MMGAGGSAASKQKAVAGTLGPHPFGQEYFQDDLPVRAATTLRGHAVRALYLASGALDVATETGDAELAAAVRAQWAAAVARRCHSSSIADGETRAIA